MNKRKMVRKETDELFVEKIKKALLFRKAYQQSPLTEENLVSLLGASRTRIREELKALEREGIIERRQKKGLYLRKPSFREIAEIFDARTGIEGFAGRLVVKVIKEENLKRLKAICSQHAKEMGKGSIEKADALDISFHREIVELSGNRIFLRIIDNFHILEKAFKICYAVHSARAIKINPYSHEEIIRWLDKRDADKTEAVLRDHIQWSRQWMLEEAMGIKFDHFKSAACTGK